MTGKHEDEAPSPEVRDELREYPAVRDDIAGLLEAARKAAVRTVNALMTTTYWAIGRRIVEAEQLDRQIAGVPGSHKHATASVAASMTLSHHLAQELQGARKAALAEHLAIFEVRCRVSLRPVHD